jgi:RimJ/RimL family protein N-acetyltransferase
MLSLRMANQDDANLLFQWRNDEQTRKACPDDRPIEWNEHLDWLERSLQNPKRKILIVEFARMPVGMVRFDFEGPEAEVSWTVAPPWRRCGIGKEMVRMAVGLLPLTCPVYARIKPDNVASIKIAEAAYLEHRWP